MTGPDSFFDETDKLIAEVAALNRRIGFMLGSLERIGKCSAAEIEYIHRIADIATREGQS